MLLVVPPVHTNILAATATQCCLFWCVFEPWRMLPLLGPRMVACHTTLTTIGKSWEKMTMPYHISTKIWNLVFLKITGWY